MKTYDNISWQKHSPPPFLRLLLLTATPNMQVISYVPVWMTICTNSVAVLELNAHRKSNPQDWG